MSELSKEMENEIRGMHTVQQANRLYLSGNLHFMLWAEGLMDYQKMPLGDLVRRIVAGDKKAAAEFERRWGIPFEQLGTASIVKEGK
jgi:hypothetical protein